MYAAPVLSAPHVRKGNRRAGGTLNVPGHFVSVPRNRKRSAGSIAPEYSPGGGGFGRGGRAGKPQGPESPNITLSWISPHQPHGPDGDRKRDARTGPYQSQLSFHERPGCPTRSRTCESAFTDSAGDAWENHGALLFSLVQANHILTIVLPTRRRCAAGRMEVPFQKDKTRIRTRWTSARF